MKKWLFNPFELVAGWQALLAGVAIMLLTTLPAFYGNIHLDGVIDLHVAGDITFLTVLLESGINWLCMTLFSCLAGFVFSRSSFRLIDVLGTQALARAPFLISCLVSLLCFNDSILRYIDYTVLHQGAPVAITVADVLLFGGMLMLTLLMTVWAVALMYKAYSVACNVKGLKGGLSFTLALLLAELLSKLLISCL